MAKHEILIYERRCDSTLLTIKEISRLVGLHPDMIQRLYLLGLIDPVIEKPHLLFDEGVLSKIAVILRLRDDLKISISSCGLVLDLLDKISELERRLDYYEQKYNS